MKKNTVHITQSVQNRLRGCAHKYWLKDELGLEPVGGFDELGALNTGHLMHLGCAEVYRAIQTMQLVKLKPTKDQLQAVAATSAIERAGVARSAMEMFEGEDAEERIAQHDEDLKSALGCLDLFVEHIAMRNFERYLVLGVEVPFEVAIPTESGRKSGDTLLGVIDLVVYDRELGRVVQGEHKSTISDAHVYELRHAVSAQSPLYTFALREIFGAPNVSNTVLLNVMRKSSPREPSINKDGSVSTAAVDTTRDVYAAALDGQDEPDYLQKAREALEAAQGLDEFGIPEVSPKQLVKCTERVAECEERWRKTREKQADRLGSLPGVERFVSQHTLELSDTQIDNCVRDIWESARLIRMFRNGRLRPWRNGSHCHTFNRLCSYHDACADGIVEPGDLLQERESFHPEVDEAKAAGGNDMYRVLTQMGILLHG